MGVMTGRTEPGPAAAGRSPLDRSPLDRAALALGATSVASTVFAVVHGDLGFLRLSGPGVAVALALGALAASGGWLRRGVIAAVAGAGFLAAALVQLVGWTTGTATLDGDGSTISLWLGLGVGLLTVALAPRTPAGAGADAGPDRKDS